MNGRQGRGGAPAPWLASPLPHPWALLWSGCTVPEPSEGWDSGLRAAASAMRRPSVPAEPMASASAGGGWGKLAADPRGQLGP